MAHVWLCILFDIYSLLFIYIISIIENTQHTDSIYDFHTLYHFFLSAPSTRWLLIGRTQNLINHSESGYTWRVHTFSELLSIFEILSCIIAFWWPNYLIITTTTAIYEFFALRIAFFLVLSILFTSLTLFRSVCLSLAHSLLRQNEIYMKIWYFSCILFLGTKNNSMYIQLYNKANCHFQCVKI